MLGRSRVNKLFVMRSLLRTEEEAHCPELYMANEGDVDISSTVVEEGRQVYQKAAHGGSSTSGGRGRGVSARMEESGEEDEEMGGGDRVRASVEGGGVERWGDASSSGDGSRWDDGGPARFHRQLQRYRKHLQDQVSVFSLLAFLSSQIHSQGCHRFPYPPFTS